METFQNDLFRVNTTVNGDLNSGGGDTVVLTLKRLFSNISTLQALHSENFIYNLFKS